MAEERQLVSHSYIFLQGKKFKCSCGKEGGVEHVLTFSDGTTREECNSCFIFDKDALDAGLVDKAESFILQKAKKKPGLDNVLQCVMAFEAIP